MVQSGALGVVGAGVMGSEIAFLGAAASDHATLVDTGPAALARGPERARASAVGRFAAARLTDDEARTTPQRLSHGERLPAHVDSWRPCAGREVGPRAGLADRGSLQPDGVEGA